jgi:hypothetical protein
MIQSCHTSIARLLRMTGQGGSSDVPASRASLQMAGRSRERRETVNPRRCCGLAMDRPRAVLASGLLIPRQSFRSFQGVQVNRLF